MAKWLSSAVARIGALALVGYIAWLGWEHLGPRKPEIGPVRKELADQLIPNIVEDVRTSRKAVRRAALLHFDNDPTDYFTNTMRSIIERRGILDLYDRTLMEKLYDLLHLRHRTYGNKDKAIRRARELKAPAVLFGTIHAFESYPTGAKIDVDVALADASGRIVFTKRYTKESSVSPLSPVVLRERTRAVPWFRRLLAWIIVVLLLPVFTISFIRAMVRQRSNWRNAFVLATYTVVDALLAYLLVGAALSSWWAVLVFIVAVVAALAYNVRVMTFALHLEES